MLVFVLLGMDGIAIFAHLMDAQVMLREEEFVINMVQKLKERCAAI